MRNTFVCDDLNDFFFFFGADSLTVEDLQSHNAPRPILSAWSSQRVPIVVMYVWIQGCVKD